MTPPAVPHYASVYGTLIAQADAVRLLGAYGARPELVSTGIRVWGHGTHVLEPIWANGQGWMYRLVEVEVYL